MRQYTDLSRPEGPLKDHIGVEFEEKAPVWVCGYCVTAEGIDEHDGVPIRRALDTCLSQEEHPKDEKSWKGVIRNSRPHHGRRQNVLTLHR